MMKQGRCRSATISRLLYRTDIAKTQHQRKDAIDTICSLLVVLMVTMVTLGVASSRSLAANTHDYDDCPLAHSSYSAETPMSDLLADPRAKDIIERDAPQVMGFVDGTAGFRLPPPFMKIMTPKFLLHGEATEKAKTVALLDRDLGALPLTTPIIAARCADYDHTPPKLPFTIKRPALLVFSKSTGFRDGPSVDAASAALKEIADRNHWALVATNDAAVFNARDLSHFNAVVWNNVSGDVLTIPQRNAFRRWIEHGGGFMGLHGSGGDPVYFWNWYADDLIGARFSGHPAEHQFQTARLIVDDPTSNITKGLGAGWAMREEWYSFAKSPRRSGAHVLVSIDEHSYDPVGFAGEDLRMGDHPIAWTRCAGDGRSFYSAIGHLPENYQEPHVVLLMDQGLTWAMGLGSTVCRQGSELPVSPKKQVKE